MRRNFVRDTAVTSASQILTLFAALAISVIVARVLGPSGKGEYTLAMLLATTLVYNCCFGLVAATAWQAGRKAYPTRLVLGHALLYALVLGALTTVVGLAITGWLAGTLVPGVSVMLLLLGLLTAVPQFLLGFLANALLGLQRVIHYNLCHLVRSFSLLVLVVALFLLLGRGAHSALLAELASFCIAVAVALFLAYRRVGGISWGLDLSYVKGSLRYGLPLYLGSVLVFWHRRAAMFLVAGFLDPAMLGLYTVSLGMAQQVSSLSEGAATVLFSRTSAQGSPAESQAFVPLVLRTVLLMVISASAVVALASPWLIPWLYSETFAGSVTPLRILLPGAVALAGWNVLDSQFKGLGKTSWSGLTNAAGVASNLGLSILWIPSYGLAGAAYAWSVSWLLAFLVAFGAYSRQSHSTWAVLLPRWSDFAMYARLVSRPLTALSRVFRQFPRGQAPF